MSRDFAIRPAQQADWPAIWAIFRAVIAGGDTYTYAPDMREEEGYAHWMSPLCHPYVALVDGKIAASCTIRTNKPGLGAHVANAGYFVADAHRRQGIARAMCRHSLLEARRLGYLAMQFNFVVSTNLPAIALWQKMGFRIIGTVPQAFRHAQFGLTEVHIMHRTLDHVTLDLCQETENTL
jgi:L-amino acid N-acyltransferase YncA